MYTKILSLVLILIFMTACAVPVEEAGVNGEPTAASIQETSPPGQPPEGISEPLQAPREIDSSGDQDLPTLTPDATSLPTSTLETTPPPLYYIQGNKVLVQTASQAPQFIGDLPEAGLVHNLIQVGEVLLVLREQGLQRMKLADGSSDMVLTLAAPVRFGEFVLTGDASRVLYSAVTDDPGAEFGFRTFVGIYQADSDSVQPVLSAPQNLGVLGLTNEESGLYLLPYGQDPSFGSVLQVEIASGEMLKELPVESYLYASLAPDGRRFATASQQCIPCEQPQAIVNLYDLPSLPLTAPRTIPLLQEPSYVSGLTWSPDGSSIYILLIPGNPWDEPGRSLGLWHLDVASEEISQVAPIEDPAMHIRTTSLDGRWMLLEHESKPDSLMVDLVTGSVLPFTRPEAALSAHWR